MSEEGTKMHAIDAGHEKWASELRAYFLDELSPAAREGFRRHVRNCSTCRVAYEKWSAAERALFGGEVEVSPLAFDRVARTVLPDRSEPEVRREFRRPLVFALAAAASLLVAGRFFLVDANQPEAFLARGGGPTAVGDLAVRAVVARFENEGAPRVFDLASTPETLRPGDRVQIRVTHGAPGFARVFLEQDGQRRGIGRLERIAPGEDIALSALIAIDDSITGGTVRFVVVVARDAAQLEAGLESERVDEDGRWVRVISAEVRR